MDAETRKTLEALADRLAFTALNGPHDQWAAPGADARDAAAIRAALREVDALTQQVRDLEARAIPKNACLYLANGMTIEEDEGEFLLWRNDDQRVTEPLPTLAAALSAAKESP